MATDRQSPTPKQEGNPKVAKLKILIPFINPMPPDEQHAFHWLPYYRSNDPDEFIRTLEDLLEHGFPVRLSISDDITAAEGQYLQMCLRQMEVRLRPKMLVKGWPMPQFIDLSGNAQKVNPSG